MALALRPVLTVDVHVEPMLSVGPGVNGEVRVIPFRGGTFTGPDGLDGVVLPGGTDWQQVRPDGVVEIRARYLLETDRREVIEVRSEGIRHAPPGVLERIAAGAEVDPDEYYFRTAVRLHTTAARLEDLNRLIYVGVGTRRRDSVHIQVLSVP